MTSKTAKPPVPEPPVDFNESAVAMAGLLAEVIGYKPPSRERSLALTKLEECVFWATRNPDVEAVTASTTIGASAT